jgi:uncharacterized protein YjbI with pentapeptide repeats
MNRKAITISMLVLLIICIFSLPIVESNNPGWLPDWTGVGEDKVIKKTTEKLGGENGKIQKFSRTEETHSGKTLWDILQLLSSLAVPFLLLYLGNKIQEKDKAIAATNIEKDKAIAATNIREEALQKFLDRVSDLLTTSQVRDGDPLPELTKDILRTRTLTLLRSLGEDGQRKGSAIHFLNELELISALEPRLELSNVDLTHAELSGTNLTRVKLNNANLSNANLSNSDLGNACLNNTNLSGAILTDTILTDTELNHSNLQNADLRNADLKGADLSGADLKGANLEGTDFNGACVEGVTGLEKAQCNLALNLPQMYHSLCKSKTT